MKNYFYIIQFVLVVKKQTNMSMDNRNAGKRMNEVK